jgi:cell division protein FtsX
VNDTLASGIAAFLALGIPSIMIAAIFLVRRVLSFREKKLELEAQIEIARAQQSGGQRIEERLRVVERIVTDKGHGLSDEIERLRIPSK